MRITTLLLLPTAVLFLTSSAIAQQVTRIPAADKLLTGTPTQQYSIGAEDGEDWELLSRVSQVAFDANENLYILDAGNNRVLVFNPAGKFVRKIGKKGGGPGELMSPVGLAITKDGYVAVTDLGRPGVSLFKADGSFVKNLMLDDSLGFPTPIGGTAAHPTGGVVVRSNPLMGGRVRGGNLGALGGPTGPRSSPITWLRADGTAKSLFSITLPSLTPKVNDSGGSNRQVSVRISQPGFTPPILWAVLPNGSVAVSDAADYRVRIANNGKVERTIERGIPARKATERDKDRARDQRRKAMKTGSGMVMAFRNAGPGGSQSSISTGGSAPRIPDAEIEQSIREMTFLETIPVLERISVDPKGRLWIQRAGKQVGDDGPVDIIDATGRYFGTINDKLPDAVSRSGRAAYIVRDDMDVEKVVVKRLPAGWM